MALSKLPQKVLKSPWSVLIWVAPRPPQKKKRPCAPILAVPSMSLLEPGLKPIEDVHQLLLVPFLSLLQHTCSCLKTRGDISNQHTVTDSVDPQTSHIVQWVDDVWHGRLPNAFLESWTLPSANTCKWSSNKQFMSNQSKLNDCVTVPLKRSISSGGILLTCAYQQLKWAKSHLWGSKCGFRMSIARSSERSQQVGIRETLFGTLGLTTGPKKHDVHLFAICLLPTNYQHYIALLLYIYKIVYNSIVVHDDLKL